MVVTIRMTGGPTETYYSPKVRLFASLHCGLRDFQSFIDECKFLYIMKYNDSNMDIDVENLQCDFKFKTLKFNPLYDIYQRIKTWCKFRI